MYHINEKSEYRVQHLHLVNKSCICKIDTANKTAEYPLSLNLFSQFQIQCDILWEKRNEPCLVSYGSTSDQGPRQIRCTGLKQIPVRSTHG